MALTALAREATCEYRRRYGRDPRWLAAAPGRVNIIGEHVDYNDGLVLPMAIDRYVVVAADKAPNAPPRMAMRVFSSAMRAETIIESDSRPSAAAGDWSSYIAGVVNLAREAGIVAPGLDVLVHSDLPPGAGLSSSAALEVSTATLLETVSGTVLSPRDKIQLCREAEHRWAGVPCGIMDQSVVVSARRDHLFLLDCRDGRSRQVPFAGPDVSFLITNSRVSHALGESPYRERRAQCEAASERLPVALRDATIGDLERHLSSDPVLLRRAHHVVTEIARTAEAAEAIMNLDWAHAGRLMNASHRSLRDDFEVSCAELDTLTELARELGEEGGVYGSRMTGGGFGGCTVTLVRSDHLDAVADHLRFGYRERTGREATFIGSRPCEGARVLDIADGDIMHG